MGHISGTFSHANPGRLQITLLGTFVQGTARDVGFPSGSSNMLVRGVVNGNYTEPIDRNAPTSYMELDYPGAGAVWSVSTDTLAVVTNGIATYGFQTLKMFLRLMKK